MACIRCCKDCIPPKRYPGCHAVCKEYLAEKAKREDSKKRMESDAIVNSYVSESKLRIKRRKNWH